MKNSIRHFKQYEIEGRENVTTKYDKTTTAVYKKKRNSFSFNSICLKMTKRSSCVFSWLSVLYLNNSTANAITVYHSILHQIGCGRIFGRRKEN